MDTRDPSPRINDAQHQVPDNTIVIVTENDRFDRSVSTIVQSLHGNSTRDWFSPHAYLCLPLVIGNQYGLVVRSLFAFDAVWNGGNSPDDVEVVVHAAAEPANEDLRDHQFISAHFGRGTLTIQNRFHFRTPPGVSLMTINPPNFFIDGLHHLTGVVETDNLERDFSFNLKLTRPGLRVHVPAGSPVGGVVPVPRYFVDGFRLSHGRELFSDDVLERERAAGRALAAERSGPDGGRPHGAGRRYFNGERADGSTFADHQTRLTD